MDVNIDSEDIYKANIRRQNAVWRPRDPQMSEEQIQQMLKTPPGQYGPTWQNKYPPASHGLAKTRGNIDTDTIPTMIVPVDDWERLKEALRVATAHAEQVTLQNQRYELENHRLYHRVAELEQELARRPKTFKHIKERVGETT